MDILDTTDRDIRKIIFKVVAHTYPTSTATPASSASLVPSLQVNVGIGKGVINSNAGPALNVAISLAGLNTDCRLHLVEE